jgi:DNA-binding MarR family transcriptional regulator
MFTFFQKKVSEIVSQISAVQQLERPVQYSHYQLLRNLYLEGPMSLTELSEINGFALPNISRGIQELTDLDLVLKMDDQSDNRKYKVSLTQKGIEFSELAVDRVNEFAEAMYADLPCDPAIVAGYFIKISENIDRLMQAPE